MRLSCSGCRVLRKGCSEDCAIRPCLQWIKTSQAQANATLFLAKFYGRAGLLNLINAGPGHLRPAIFKSLLYEACGRIVNPIFGSTGLMLSGSWHLCQAAVEAVLKGDPITQISTESAVGCVNAPLKAFDIRHVPKDESSASQLHKVKSRSRFKRSASKPKAGARAASAELAAESDNVDSGRVIELASNDESRTSRQPSPDGDSVSVETVEASIVKRDSRAETDTSDLELELTLAIGPSNSVIRGL